MLDRFLKILCHVSGAVLLACLVGTFFFPDFFGIHLVGVQTPTVALVPPLVLVWTAVTAALGFWMVRFGQAPPWFAIPSAVLLVVVMALSGDHIFLPLGSAEQGKGILLGIMGTILLFTATGAAISWESKKKADPALRA
jgi:hypothetical protein